MDGKPSQTVNGCRDALAGARALSEPISTSAPPPSTPNPFFATPSRSFRNTAERPRPPLARARTQGWRSPVFCCPLGNPYSRKALSPGLPVALATTLDHWTRFILAPSPPCSSSTSSHHRRHGRSRGSRGRLVVVGVVVVAVVVVVGPRLSCCFSIDALCLPCPCHRSLALTSSVRTVGNQVSGFQQPPAARRRAPPCWRRRSGVGAIWPFSGTPSRPPPPPAPGMTETQI
ncbi:uncharacterized protein K452DRAFT_5484 [Aplosporella prunicola CBS 121167]|uniref:Uncharacterized protein n=1 Tax=Aplosporella prunicola CBS 121167 TaxID=1176127 RepID=A0A6A6BVG4_9PEZI|nr:uncharacterized protein K452DRAFT_5484 [Aplosporella prunicola CBS 121167]KAF2147323.1 hypothetical protein K452DRAFT_5484 [Aplosporella prunicola CBS 121167]